MFEFPSTISADGDNHEIFAQWRAALDEFCNSGRLLPFLVDTNEAMRSIDEPLDDETHTDQYEDEDNVLNTVVCMIEGEIQARNFDYKDPAVDAEFVKRLLSEDFSSEIFVELNQTIQSFVAQACIACDLAHNEDATRAYEKLVDLKAQHGLQPA